MKWIEELIGRRLSLEADQVIAASDSGFTEGAKRKAHRYGILLRDLQMVTHAEVATWGKRTELELCYYRLSRVQFQLDFEGSPPSPDRVANYLIAQPDIVSSVLNGTKYVINGIDNKSFPLCIQTELQPSVPVLVDGARVVAFKVRYEANEIRIRHLVPTVSTYSEPDSNKPAHAVVETSDAMTLEIIKSKEQCFIHIDLSTLPAPRPDEIFAGIVHFENVWNLSPKKMILFGNQELPTKLSTFELVSPPIAPSSMKQDP
ncbi:MAG: hypothetical protein A2Z90_08315 [Burkholderiales bacterium GWA2_64_37]|nr:MAG: hypothetical protein A2Z90_08315 [Burkholderiales bacterium GWA2_64_37]